MDLVGSDLCRACRSYGPLNMAYSQLKAVNIIRRTFLNSSSGRFDSPKVETQNISHIKAFLYFLREYEDRIIWRI